jgi:hypothetical protein
LLRCELWIFWAATTQPTECERAMIDTGRGRLIDAAASMISNAPKNVRSLGRGL